MQSGVIRACAVRLLHGRRVLARGRKLASAPNAHALTVRVKLTKRGRKLLADHLGGVHVKVAAIGATGDGTRSAPARSRAILGREHVVTPPGLAAARPVVVVEARQTLPTLPASKADRRSHPPLRRL